MVCYSDAQYHGNKHLNSGPVLKWWSEYLSVNQMVIWTMNYHSTGYLNSKPFCSVGWCETLHLLLIRMWPHNCCYIFIIVLQGFTSIRSYMDSMSILLSKSSISIASSLLFSAKLLHIRLQTNPITHLTLEQIPMTWIPK